MVPWFTSGFHIRQGMQQNIMPVPTFKLSFQVQFFAETYFRVFKSLAKIAKISAYTVYDIESFSDIS